MSTKTDGAKDIRKKVNLLIQKQGYTDYKRNIFLSGQERTFLLFMDSCCLCGGCTGKRERCAVPRTSRPSPEAMAVDVYSTVRQFGFPIEVRTDYSQAMSRYAFLMIH